MRPISCIVAVLGLLVPVLVHAGVPDPRHSTIPAYMLVCPDGGFTQTINVRDVNNSPLNGVDVVIDFCAFSTFHLCTADPGDPYTIQSGCVVHVLTNAIGNANLPIRAGGGASGLIEISANGVFLGYALSAASPDQNASGIVDAADAALLAAKIGTFAPPSDLNLDGHVDAADAAILTAHLGHACAAPTPVRAATWGQVRQAYR